MKKAKYASLFLSLLALVCCSTSKASSSYANSSNKDNSSLESSLSSETKSSENSSILSSVNSSKSDSSKNESSEIPPLSNTKAKNVTNYVSEQGQVPLINITLNDGAFPVDKENYVPGSLNIVEQPNNENIILPATSMGLRLRGNSTIRPPKKAFRIKFDAKTSLFGLPKAKSWVLLANYFDKSNIRNYLAYLTANKLNNLHFQPSSIFVDVNINGEYQGLYLLCEQMQTGSNRIDIENQTNKDGMPSFLLELEFKVRVEGVEGKDYFMYKDKYYQIKYPEYPTEDQCQYIKQYMITLDDAIKAKTGYEELMDVDSFIDGYFVEELFKNVDVGNGSCYYYLPADGKLTFGPVWDFDIGLDAVGERDYYEYKNSRLWARDKNRLFNKLFLDEACLAKAQTRYKEIRNLLVENFAEIEIVKSVLDDAMKKNEERWPINDGFQDTIIERYNTEYKKNKSYREHISYVSDKLTQRLEILDTEYNK